MWIIDRRKKMKGTEKCRVEDKKSRERKFSQ